MSFRLRLLLGYFVIIGLAAVFFLNLFVREMQPGVRQAMEETMVDTAYLLAEMAAPELIGNRINRGAFARALERFKKQRMEAHIWKFTKSTADLRVYITDPRGIVVFDSDKGRDVGKDYSQWNDVYRTLRGQYGARSTREDPKLPLSSVSYVAAPVMYDGHLIGVLSVAKPNISVQPYIELAERKVKTMGALLLAGSLLLGVLFSFGLSRSVRRLADYARAVSRGERAALPRSGSTELSALGKAMETMRQELEGKAYVERYVQTLTHEMKSPLSGISSAAELLTEDMDRESRQRFLANIRSEAGRLLAIIERMLDLAVLEKKGSLEASAPVDLVPLAREVVASRQAMLVARQLKVEDRLADTLIVQGDAFLLRQAIGNLLDNAIAFSPKGGAITLRNGQGALVLEDQGPGVPDYALSKIFERFYSLPRPDTGKKSSGLGLNFVREIMALHKGQVVLENRPEGGVRASLLFA